MKSRRPPVVATWMIEHLTPGGGDEAFAGDLLEEFRQGRTAGWYWRQSLAAIVTSYLQACQTRWMSAIFAALWVIPVPALFFWMATDAGPARILNSAWGLPWPWSTICEMGFYIGANVLFLWTGLLAYLLLRALAMRNPKPPRIMRGLLLCSLLYIPFSVAWAMLPHPFGHPVVIHRVTATQLIFDPNHVFERMPVFLNLLLSIWASLPHAKHRFGSMAA